MKKAPKIPFRVRLWLLWCKLTKRICIYVGRPIEVDPENPLETTIELTEFSDFLANLLRDLVQQKKLDKETAKKIFTEVMHYTFGETYEDYITEILEEVE